MNSVRQGSVALVDMDGDGDQDLPATTSSELSWWENVGEHASWRKHILGEDLKGLKSIHGADLNSDGITDVLAAVSSRSRVSWWETIYPIPFAMDSDTHSVISTDAKMTVRSDIATSNLAANTQWTCLSWERRGSEPAAGLGAHTEAFNLTNDTTVVFNWGLQHWLQMDITGPGRVDRESDWVTEDEVLTLHATPDNFAVFTGWSGDVPTGKAQDNPLILSWDQARLLVAHFSNETAVVTVRNSNSDSNIRPEQLRERFVFSSNGEAVWAMHGTDLDGDQDLDLLTTSLDSDELVWRENVGSGSRWLHHIIDEHVINPYAVSATDMDGDGDIDVLAAADSPKTMVWWENKGSDSDWLPHIVDGESDNGRAITGIDIDLDGDIDVVGISGDDETLSWWENQRDAIFWTKHSVLDLRDYRAVMHLEDVDQDGDADIVLMSYTRSEIYWLENDGSGSGWQRHDIDDAFSLGRDIALADVDSDGDLDLGGPGERERIAVLVGKQRHRTLGAEYDSNRLSQWSKARRR